MTPTDLATGALVFVHPWLGQHCSAEHIKHAALARAMRIDPSIVAHWIAGHRPVPHNRLAQLAGALDIDAEALLAHARIEHDPHAPQQTATPAEPTRLDVTEQRTQVLSALLTPTDVAEAMAERVLPPPGPPPIPPSDIALRWCSHAHGSGRARRHHHGVQAPWAARVTTDIAELA